VEAYVNRGRALNHRNDFRNAVNDYDRAISLDPNNAVAYYNRGSLYTVLNMPSLAAKDYAEAIRLDPKLKNEPNYTVVNREPEDFGANRNVPNPDDDDKRMNASTAMGRIAGSLLMIAFVIYLFKRAKHSY
jgi:tetratricopeptide (TPR) repeat protein